MMGKVSSAGPDWAGQPPWRRDLLGARDCALCALSSEPSILPSTGDATLPAIQAQLLASSADGTGQDRTGQDGPGQGASGLALTQLTVELQG